MTYGKGILDLKGWTKSPFYTRWVSMIQRCYDKGSLLRDPSYRGVTVCEEWLTFSTFKSWMELQDWKGKCLDKDLKGGDIYSPETCLFITEDLNRYWTMKRKGVSWEEDRQKWRVKIGRQHIGRFTNEEDARAMYEKCKRQGLSAFFETESEDVVVVLKKLHFQ